MIPSKFDSLQLYIYTYIYYSYDRLLNYSFHVNIIWHYSFVNFGKNLTMISPVYTLPRAW